MKLLKQRYHLGKVIGQGAMGRVFLARDIQTQQKVAIKEHFVKKGPNQEMYIKRIQREFHFLQKIDHPYVVKAFELFYEHNRYFIVMQYIPGITLEHLLQKEYQSLSVEEQLTIAVKICETTSEINQTGIVHRDIKPANIILHHETYEPYIIDLGIAKQVNDELSSLTRSGDIVGTPDYLSPEAVIGETYPSSDVFSVGTILYQFFSWQRHSPFFAGSMVSTIDKIVNKNLLPLHEAYPNSDPMFHRVSLVLSKSLQKDHLRRISSLAEFASLLRKCRPQEEIVQKNTTTVWWGVAVLIFVIVVAAAMFFSPGAEQLLATYQKKAAEYTAQKKYNLAIDYYSKVLEISNKAQVYFQRGQVYQSQAKFNEAIADFDRALQKNRQMPEVYFHRAQIYYQQKKYDLAVSDLNLATRYNQKFFDAYWMRASIYEQQQKYKLAMDEYTTIIEFQPQNAEAYKERGLLHLKQEHYDYAIADLKICIEKAPQYKQILSLEIAKAKDKAKAQKNPRANLELATNYVTQGIQYEKTRQYELAINSYTKAIEINPNNLAAYSNRGVIYSKMYKFKLAIDDFSEIIKRDNKQVLVYMDRGVAYEGLQDFPRAIQDYTKAIEISPQEIYGYVQRGTLYALLKEYDKAISDFTQVLHIIPNHPMAFYHRGMAYYDQQKYQQAIENFSSAISAKPNYTQAYLARADAYKKLQKYYLAINNYSLLLRTSPNNVELLKLRGVAYADKKDHHHAIKDFTRGISISPSIFLYQSRAYSYMQQQQYEKALHDLQIAIQMDKKDSYSYYARGEINQKRGNNTQALEDFNTAIKLNSSDPMYFYSRALLYHDEKKYQQALQDLDTAISLKKDVSFYNHKGIVYEKLLLDEKAIAEYNKALELDPDFMYGYYNRGLVYNRTRKFELAIADFNRAISHDKNYHESYHARALAHKALGQRNLALADLQQAISLKPHSGHYYNRGLIHEEKGDYRSAVADYKKSIGLNAKYTKAYVRLANIYELHDKYRSAIRFWQKCHKLQPNKGWDKNIAFCQKAMQGSYQRKTYQTLQEAITVFYNQKSKWAGIYRIDSIEKLQIEWQKNMVVKVNVRYKYRLEKPLKSYKEQGFDQRFFIAKKIDNRFAVIEMGEVNSAHFN